MAELPDELIGQVIEGRFEIRAKLGQGGMGAVYRAWQKSVDREVAIKLIHRAFTSDPMAVHRFEREARLASKLSQPNTVSIFDFGTTADGRMFLAMELIRGRTLHRVLSESGPFPIERVVRVGTQICDAVEAAHGLGIVHRDLKLENVILLDEPPGRDLIKVLDFGLAKYEGDMRGTAAGVVVGTPRYMAPETTTTGAAVAASDLYAVGVMLAELATGASPWQGNSIGELLAHKLAPAPAIANVPAPLRALIGALLDPSPERRPTAAQTRHWLGGVASGQRAPMTAPPMEAPTVPGKVQRVRRRSRRPWVIATIGAGVLALVSLGLYLPTRHELKEAEHVAPGPAPTPAPKPAPVSRPVREALGSSDPWAETPSSCAEEMPTDLTDVACMRKYCAKHVRQCIDRFCKGSNCTYP